jgi:nitronate monooxygenase
VDGFVVEGPDAGGHNAPPRGKLQLNGAGEPVYGERDRVDPAKMRELGVPFWLAGGYGSAERLAQALEAGAAGIQVGTAFAFCTESGLRPDYRLQSLHRIASGQARIFTDPAASPTGFPFKVVSLEGTESEEAVYRARPRVCDMGYLREAYRTEAGEIGYRCAGEPVTVYESKGGRAEKTLGRKCLCNALMANIGLPQIRNGKRTEPGLLTAGDDLPNVARFLPAEGLDYSAADVIARIVR